MAKTYGEDLRSRVIDAVERGMTRRAAAERFEVAISTAVRWVQAWREEGRRVAPGKGGDTRSHRIEVHREVILAALEGNKDITLVELVALLADQHGVRVAPSTVHRFFVRHRITLKKRPRTPASRSGRTWRTSARPGLTASPILIPSG